MAVEADILLFLRLCGGREREEGRREGGRGGAEREEERKEKEREKLDVARTFQTNSFTRF